MYKLRHECENPHKKSNLSQESWRELVVHGMIATKYAWIRTRKPTSTKVPRKSKQLCDFDCERTYNLTEKRLGSKKFRERVSALNVSDRVLRFQCGKKDLYNNSYNAKSAKTSMCKCGKQNSVDNYQNSVFQNCVSNCWI